MTTDHTNETASKDTGPKLLEERSIGGIFVHFIAIPTGAFGAGMVYLAASNEFTKRNARNALEWHLTVLLLTTVTFGSLLSYAELTGQGATNIVTAPASVASVGGLVVVALLSLWMGLTAWTFVVGFVAMGKAVFGTAWRYPFTPNLVDRVAGRIELSDRWPTVIFAYIVVAPLVVGAVVLGPFDGVGFLLTWLGLFGLTMLLAPLTAVAIYLHGERDRPKDASWQPPVVAYIGAPVAVAVAGYMLFGTLIDSIYPAGDAVYVFFAALWVSAIAYLVRWRTVAN